MLVLTLQSELNITIFQVFNLKIKQIQYFQPRLTMKKEGNQYFQPRMTMKKRRQSTLSARDDNTKRRHSIISPQVNYRNKR